MQKVIVPTAAYCIYQFCGTTPYWNYVNVYGPCWNCNDVKLPGDYYIYGKIMKEGRSREEVVAEAAAHGGMDMRTLRDLKIGCCPVYLGTDIIASGPG